MSEQTGIEWCDSTFNPWEGCQKVGPGCDHCYAEARNARYAGGTAINWGPGAPRRRTSISNWNLPRRWEREAAAFFAEHGHRRRVFCASLADVFDNAVDRQWRVDLFELIEDTPSLDWLLLTKRIGNVQTMLTDVMLCMRDLKSRHGQQWPWPNVWLGATIVNQEEADRDIRKLLAVPARVRFLSIEPLLGPLCLDCFPVFGEDEQPLLHWVIVGGESGPESRPMHPDWVRDLRDQCAAAGVPFLFKQWGEWRHDDGSGGFDGITDALRASLRGTVRAGSEELYRYGKKAAGRQLDGAFHDGYPAATQGGEQP